MEPSPTSDLGDRPSLFLILGLKVSFLIHLIVRDESGRPNIPFVMHQ